MQPIFPTLIMNSRPGAGKSEITHFLQQIPLSERIARFHIGPMHVLDDFPLLWSWYEEDDLLERILGRPRLHTTHDGYFIHDDLWHLLIRRISLDYDKLRRDANDESTIVIEFARGTEHGGYRAAYHHLSDAILQQAACLYIRVSYQESLRKNRARRNIERPYSILEHSLSDEKLERLYLEDDWNVLAAANPTHLTVRGIDIPYVVFENEDDVTTTGGMALGDRLETILDKLWSIRNEGPSV